MPNLQLGIQLWGQATPWSDIHDAAVRVVEDDDTVWRGTPEQLAERLAPYVEPGFRTVISEQQAPYDMETRERFIGEVRPLAEAAVGAAAT